MHYWHYYKGSLTFHHYKPCSLLDKDTPSLPGKLGLGAYLPYPPLKVGHDLLFLMMNDAGLILRGPGKLETTDPPPWRHTQGLLCAVTLEPPTNLQGAPQAILPSHRGLSLPAQGILLSPKMGRAREIRGYMVWVTLSSCTYLHGWILGWEFCFLLLWVLTSLYCRCFLFSGSVGERSAKKK